jgi:hypothetical protein
MNTKLIQFALLIPIASSIAFGQARSGSWGDQGDGTYRNPVLNADYPDVDVEQVGDSLARWQVVHLSGPMVSPRSAKTRRPACGPRRPQAGGASLEDRQHLWPV